jgi:hypothetical protein
MSENPYVAPANTSSAKPLSPAAIGIRSVSRAYRFLGWAFFIPYLPMTGGTFYAFINAYWRSGVTEKSQMLLLATAINATMTIVMWMYIRVGKRLKTPQPRDYRPAMILACLLVILFLPLGILCVWYLRKYWKSCCEEMHETLRG